MILYHLRVHNTLLGQQVKGVLLQPAAQFASSNFMALDFDSSGTLYISDYGRKNLRKLSAP